MIIHASAPLRISLFGGGTDLPVYYEKFGGVTIDIAINLRQYISLYTGEDIFGYSSKYEKDIFPIGADPSFLYTILREYQLGGGHLAKIKSTCDGFLHAGLGSSAAAAVALLGAIAKVKNSSLTKHEIAHAAYIMENDSMHWYGGKQDQFASVYGGANVFEFFKTDVRITPIEKASITPITNSMVLFYTGPRKTQHIQENLRELDTEQIHTLHLLKEIALGSLPYIGNGNYKEIGKLLHISWKLKRKINPGVSSDEIDAVYDYAMKQGAYGGKLCGSGAGGYMFFIVEPELRASFVNEMRNMHMEEVDFAVTYDGLQARRI